ncbi:MAG: NAD(P)H-dependent oxidoreductase subunit E [Halofilum sp. (in: g-proteobacteria)]|nr:NAD(P)H-dependent oxidoreductase subunit E [Halofilum sp. (in: g-proteobacteria)]
MCTNVSCMLCGADELVAHVERRLGCRRGETTADGRIFLKQEEECLAACRGAPMMQVDHVHYDRSRRPRRSTRSWISWSSPQC